jgi:hypothetical protein
MARVLMTWNRPYHLSVAEGEAWARTEVERLSALPGVEAVTLTRAGAAGFHARPGDWICELHLRPDADGAACVGHPACAEWLLDLRLLGMRPAVAILDGTQVIG